MFGLKKVSVIRQNLGNNTAIGIRGESGEINLMVNYFHNWGLIQNVPSKISEGFVYFVTSNYKLEQKMTEAKLCKIHEEPEFAGVAFRTRAHQMALAEIEAIPQEGFLYQAAENQLKRERRKLAMAELEKEIASCANDEE
jgi:hypothetical protein